MFLITKCGMRVSTGFVCFIRRSGGSRKSVGCLGDCWLLKKGCHIYNKTLLAGKQFADYKNSITSTKNLPS